MLQPGRIKLRGILPAGEFIRHTRNLWDAVPNKMTESSQNTTLGAKLSARYELIAPIDRMGSSVVYKVRDRQDGIIKALKVIPVVNESGSERFLADAEKVKNEIHFRGVARLREYGIVEDDGVKTGFLVHDLISGRSLYQLLNRQGRVELKDALDIFIQLVSAIEYLHEHGLVHLALSPRKVMLSDSDDCIIVKILDTGLSRHLCDLTIDPAEELKMFPEGVLYLSPEQCGALPADHRTDIYAVGCIMYECLVGLPPFLSKSPYEVTRMHIGEEAKPLRMSRDDLNFPLELDLLVLKSLRKNLNQRQQTMTELRDDLLHARDELAKMPEEIEQRTASKGIMPEVFSSIIEDIAELIGMDSALKVKLAVPIILGFVVVFGSILVGMALHPHQVRLAEQESPQEKKWRDLDEEGQRYFERGDIIKAENTYLKALPLAEKFGDKDARLLVTLRKLVDVYQSEKRYDKVSETETRVKALMGEDEID